MTSTVDLFCGCGGLSLGAREADLKPRVAVDVDVTLSSAYRLNFPMSRVVNEDLAGVDPRALQQACGSERVSAVVGGPPCQGFSVMGRRRREDPRNALVGHFFRVVDALRPRIFVMENVPGLKDPGTRQILDAGLDQLPPDYTVLEPMILDAADFGAATSRPRLIVIGYDQNDVDPVSPTDFSRMRVESPVTVRDAISDLPEPVWDGDWGYYSPSGELCGYAQAMRRLPNAPGIGDPAAIVKLRSGELSGLGGTQHTDAVIQRFRELPQGKRDPVSRYPKLAWDRSAWVLRAGTGKDQGSYQAARPIHPESPRVVTAREAARIQGFPDWYQFHPTKWHSHRMIGNSVSPVFAKAIFSVLVEKMGVMGGERLPMAG